MGERILIVDDEPDITRLCTRMLRGQNYTVQGSTSGREAIRLLESEPFDLLVFDNASCEPVREYLQVAHKQGRIQYLTLSDRNVGKGGAWNLIFGGAPGEIVAYADADVLFRPGWLTRTLEIMDAYPNTGMVTARPLRTPEAFYSSTLVWAHETKGVTLERDRFIPWETYLEHVLSLGTDEAQAREWYNSRLDWRLTYKGHPRLRGRGPLPVLGPQRGAARVPAVPDGPPHGPGPLAGRAAQRGRLPAPDHHRSARQAPGQPAGTGSSRRRPKIASRKAASRPGPLQEPSGQKNALNPVRQDLQDLLPARIVTVHENR